MRSKLAWLAILSQSPAAKFEAKQRRSLSFDGCSMSRAGELFPPIMASGSESSANDFNAKAARDAKWMCWSGPSASSAWEIRAASPARLSRGWERNAWHAKSGSIVGGMAVRGCGPDNRIPLAAPPRQPKAHGMLDTWTAHSKTMDEVRVFGSGHGFI